MLALVLLLSLPASLDGDATFEQGKQLYEHLDYERAALRFHEAALVPGRPPADRALLNVWLGLVYATMGELDNAGKHRDEAGRDDVAVRAPDIPPPSVAALLGAARAREQQRGADAAMPPPVDP